jgi:hypothetical protein
MHTCRVHFHVVPVMAVVAIGETPMSPTTVESGTVARFSRGMTKFLHLSSIVSV